MCSTYAVCMCEGHMAFMQTTQLYFIKDWYTTSDAYNDVPAKTGWLDFFERVGLLWWHPLGAKLSEFNEGCCAQRLQLDL